MQIKLTQNGQETERRFDKHEIIVGRPNPYATPDLDLTPDATASRTHARIWKAGDHYWIEDLNSRYGTLVNHVKLHYRRELQPGDVVQIGETTLRVHVADLDATVKNPTSPVAPDVQVDQAVNAEDSSLTAISNGQPGRLLALLELPAQFGSAGSMDTLLPLVLQRVSHMIPGAVRGAILLHEANTGKLEVRATLSEDSGVSDTLVNRALTEGRGFIWRKLVDGVPSESVRRIGSKTGMYVPLLWKNRALGVICVDNSLRDSAFDNTDLRLLLALAHYAGMAVANHQLEAALADKEDLLKQLRDQSPPKRRRNTPAA